MSILPEALPVLVPFVKMYNKELRSTTLQLIDYLIKKHLSSINIDLLKDLITEIMPLINDSDLDAAHGCLLIIKSVDMFFSEALRRLRRKIMKKVVKLIISPVIEGKSHY